MHQDRLNTPRRLGPILTIASPALLAMISFSRTSIHPISEPRWRVLWMLDFYNPGPDGASWAD